jgi:hypothetical protein
LFLKGKIREEGLQRKRGRNPTRKKAYKAYLRKKRAYKT